MMNKSFVEKLRKKGWSEEDIERTEKILSKKKRSILDKFVYWFVLVMTIIANMILAVILVPFLLALSDAALYSIIIIIALTFGFLFDMILRDLENLDPQHHVIAGIFIPAIAIINVFYMTRFSNKLIDLMTLPNTKHDPLIIGTLYTITFIIPYLTYRLFANKEFLKYLRLSQR